MLRDTTAQKIASNWHNGQWSALYSFASSGRYLTEYHLKYLQEIEDCLHPEYALYPGTLNKKDNNDLNNLKQYFLTAGVINRIYTEYVKHPDYGYLMPFVKTAPENILSTIKNLQYSI